MNYMSWLPEIVRKQPQPLELWYRSDGTVHSSSRIEARLQAVLGETGLEWRQRDDGRAGFFATLVWHTAVLGVLRRGLDEQVEVTIVNGRRGPELRVFCRPDATHDAHASGYCLVIVLAFLAWLAGGWSGGPAGLTTLVAGSLLAVSTRGMAMTVLKRRLQRLTEDIGIALWPPNSAAPLPF